MKKRDRGLKCTSFFCVSYFELYLFMLPNIDSYLQDGYYLFQ